MRLWFFVPWRPLILHLKSHRNFIYTKLRFTSPHCICLCSGSRSGFLAKSNGTPMRGNEKICSFPGTFTEKANNASFNSSSESGHLRPWGELKTFSEDSKNSFVLPDERHKLYDTRVGEHKGSVHTFLNRDTVVIQDSLVVLSLIGD